MALRFSKMKRVLLILVLTTAVVIGLIIAVAYVATMGAVGHFASTFKHLPKEYGIEAETIHFKSLDGVDLKGWWISAEANRDSPATVILAHGNGGNRSSMLSRAVFLASNGYNAFPIDLRAHGESSGNYMTPGYLEALDILGAVEAVKRKGLSGPFIALGHSYGARASLWAAAQTKDISAVIADSAFISIYATLKRQAAHVGTDPNGSFWERTGLQMANALSESALARSFMGSVYEWRTGKRMTAQFDNVMPAISQIGDRPILFIVGDKDYIAPPEDSQQMYDAASSPRKAMVVIPGANHNSTFDANPTLYETKVLAFLGAVTRSNQSMKPTAPLRNRFSVFAMTPCRGLALSR
jgi:pimeloyl-ACP methyl ester carboxylesterase